MALASSSSGRHSRSIAGVVGRGRAVDRKCIKHQWPVYVRNICMSLDTSSAGDTPLLYSGAPGVMARNKLSDVLREIFPSDQDIGQYLDGVVALCDPQQGQLTSNQLVDAWTDLYRRGGSMTDFMTQQGIQLRL